MGSIFWVTLLIYVHILRLSCVTLLTEASKTVSFTNFHRTKSGGVKSEDPVDHLLVPYLTIQEFENKSFQRELTSRNVGGGAHLIEREHLLETF